MVSEHQEPIKIWHVVVWQKYKVSKISKNINCPATKWSTTRPFNILRSYTVYHTSNRKQVWERILLKYGSNKTYLALHVIYEKHLPKYIYIPWEWMLRWSLNHIHMHKGKNTMQKLCCSYNFRYTSTLP